MQTILGLDVSSTTIGWAIVSVDNGIIKLVDHGNIKPPNKDDYHFVERLDITLKSIENLCLKLKPDHVIVEDIIQYMDKRTTANTIIVLAMFNRGVAMQTYRSTGKHPVMLLPVSIRARLRKFLSLDKIDKEDIPGILQSYFGKAFFEITGYKTRGKNKGQPIIETYDEADAVAAAWAGAIELKLIKDKYTK